jgi:hypothetical protein
MSMTAEDLEDLRQKTDAARRTAARHKRLHGLGHATYEAAFEKAKEFSDLMFLYLTEKKNQDPDRPTPRRVDPRTILRQL